jgi:hypothetical protein
MQDRKLSNYHGLHQNKYTASLSHHTAQDIIIQGKHAFLKATQTNTKPPSPFPPVPFPVSERNGM